MQVALAGGFGGARRSFTGVTVNSILRWNPFPGSGAFQTPTRGLLNRRCFVTGTVSRLLPRPAEKWVSEPDGRRIWLVTKCAEIGDCGFSSIALCRGALQQVS